MFKITEFPQNQVFFIVQGAHEVSKRTPFKYLTGQGRACLRAVAKFITSVLNLCKLRESTAT